MSSDHVEGGHFAIRTLSLNISLLITQLLTKEVEQFDQQNKLFFYI